MKFGGQLFFVLKAGFGESIAPHLGDHLAQAEAAVRALRADRNRARIGADRSRAGKEEGHSRGRPAAHTAFHHRTCRVLIAGLLFGAAGFAIYGLATTSVEFWAGIPVMALWGLAGAASMGIMSRLVGVSEQGQLQGANSSIMALAGLFGPGLFTQAFARSIAPGEGWHLPGAPFLLAAGLRHRRSDAGLAGDAEVHARRLACVPHWLPAGL